MKKFILGTAMALVMSTAAHAETVGVSMAKFDDNFLTVLRNGMTDYAKTLSGVTPLVATWLVALPPGTETMTRQVEPSSSGYFSNGVVKLATLGEWILVKPPPPSPLCHS